MFARKNKQDAALTRVSTPYADAQHVWVERYGSHIQQAYNWRLVAMLEAVALIVAVVGLIYVASQTKFVPYVVAIDKVGAAFSVFPADRASSIDQRVVHAELGRFIIEARTVTADRALEKIALEHAYNYVPPGSASRGFLDEYYPKNDPFQRAQDGSVQVTVTNVLPVSPTSYEVQWVETSRTPTGNLKKSDDWVATATTEFRPPADESAMLRNPIGLYITALVWEKKS